jgi:hypothetical protein
MRHPLRRAAVARAVEAAASAHLGRPWRRAGFTDLSDRASHPCGVFHGRPFSVFAKLAVGADGVALFAAYREITPIDPGFPARRELWRLPGYLAVVAVDDGPFAREILPRLAAIVKN